MRNEFGADALALVVGCYANGEQVIKAMAQEANLDYVNLAEISISPAIVELGQHALGRDGAFLRFMKFDTRNIFFRIGIGRNRQTAHVPTQEMSRFVTADTILGRYGFGHTPSDQIDDVVEQGGLPDGFLQHLEGLKFISRRFCIVRYGGGRKDDRKPSSRR